jgi:hypothetical protein
VSGAGVQYLPDDLPQERRAALEGEIARLGAEAPYGWGHTLDLGAGLRIEGLLAENYRHILAGWRRLRSRKITQRQMAFKRGLNYPFNDMLDARRRVFDRLRPDDDTSTPG